MKFYYIWDSLKDCYVRAVYVGSCNLAGTKLLFCLAGGQEKQVSNTEVFFSDKRVYS